jgi:hypothetical protein
MAETNGENQNSTPDHETQISAEGISEHFENDNDNYDDDCHGKDDQAGCDNAAGFPTCDVGDVAETDYYDEDDVNYDDDDDDDSGEYVENTGIADDVENDDDSNTTVDDAIYRQFFEQLIEAKKLSAKKQQDTQFFPATRRYLTASFANREKMLNKRMQTNLLYLAGCIVDGKIDLSLPDVDREFMIDILSRATPKEDVRLHLLEDRRLHIYFRKALNLIEQQQHKQTRDGGKRKKTNNDRCRKVQLANNHVTRGDATTKDSRRFNQNTRRSRIGGESSRNGEVGQR